MTKFEVENLKKVFKTAKSVLDDFGFPNLYTVNSYEVKNWTREVLSNSENAWTSEDDGVVLESNEIMVRVERGATKLVIISSEADNWVFKIPFNDYKSNYCQMEVEIYENAEREGVEEFFAPCYFLENFDGAAIYVMARAEVSFNRLYSDLYERFSSEGRAEDEIENMLIDIEDSDEYVDWLFPYYSDYDSFEKFVEFLRSSNINDLHSGNIGYIGDNVVLIDYSGYFG